MAEMEKGLKKRLAQMERTKQLVLQQLSALQREEASIEDQLARVRRRQVASKEQPDTEPDHHGQRPVWSTTPRQGQPCPPESHPARPGWPTIV